MTGIPLQLIAQRWLSGKSEHTTQAYRRVIEAWVRLSEERQRQPSEWTHRELESFLFTVVQKSGGRGRPCRTPARSSLSQRRSCLNGFFKHLLQHGLIEHNLIQEIQLPECESASPSPPAVEPKLAILNGFRRLASVHDMILRSRDEAIALLILHHGVKRGDIVALRCTDRMTRGRLFVARTQQVLLLSKASRQAIDRWLRARQSTSPYLFVSYARKRQGEQAMSSLAIRHLTMKYFELSPQDLIEQSRALQVIDW